MNDIVRYVAKRSCPKDCKDDEHKKHEVIVRYHIPFLGMVFAEGATEEDADKEAKIKSSEEIAKLYALRLKEMAIIEKLLEFK